MKKIAIGVCVCSWLAVPTFADYISGKVAWDNMPLSEKYGYVMGAFDGGSKLIRGSDGLNMYNTDRSNCVYEMGLTSKDLVEIVNIEYQDLSKWDYSASVVLDVGLRKVCLPHMNRARAERGDDLLD